MGLELLLGCDLIVASAAAEFGLPEVRRGLFPGGGGTAIGRRIPLAVALEMTMTGTTISAQRAYEVGLVNTVVATRRGRCYGARAGTADRGQRSRSASRRARSWFDSPRPVEPAVVERRDHWRAVVFESDDAREGATAYVERRDPVWRGDDRAVRRGRPERARRGVPVVRASRGGRVADRPGSAAR